jgi:hypothetical protein
MNKKLQRELHGPGWGEVILGALLSLVLGIVLAMAFLIFTPVVKVREMPKEPDAKVVYYLEGSAAASRAHQAQTKAKSFLQGQSVTLNEDELNSIVYGFRAQPPKPAKPTLTSAPPDKVIEPGSPNFRIRDSVLQIGVPLKLSAYGLKHEVIFQARGRFTKSGDTFVFDPNEVFVGSCALERLPVIRDMILKRLVAATEVPPELPTAWQKLTDVSLEGSNLKLTTAIQ